MLNQKRSRLNLPLNKKYEIIQYVESLESKNGKVALKDISQKFEINISTLSLLLKNQENNKNLVQNVRLASFRQFGNRR